MSAHSLDVATEAVMRHVTRGRLVEAVCGMVDIASPTGHERPLASWIADRLRAARVDAAVQPIDDFQANAVATMPGGDGPSLLLYAPIDTFTTGVAELDVPGASATWRSDLAPRAVVTGDLVEGLGAGNPKGHAAVVMVVLQAFADAAVEPAGDLVGGFGAGGMPSFAVPGVGNPERTNTGHGVGASFLLERGHTTDYAVIAKPGWTVLHEEVGLVWLDVVVPGLHTYVGSRHRLPYSNAVASAARVTIALEEWLAAYAERHQHGTMEPQGIVSSVQGGIDRLAASTAAQVRLRLDLRLTTRQTVPEVVREVRAELRRLSAEFGVELQARQIAAIPATHTPPGSPVVRAAIAAFEAVQGGPHEIVMRNSGATDANILRMRGVPTARVGMPKVTAAPDGGAIDFSRGMNLADVEDMRRLAEVLVRTVLELPGIHDASPR